MPPKEELFRPFEHRVNVRRAKSGDWPVLEWEEIESQIYFRPQGASPEIVWVHGRVYSRNIWTKKSGELSEDFARLISYHYRRLEFYRVVPLGKLDDALFDCWAFASIKGGKALLDIGRPLHGGKWARWVTSISWDGGRRAFLEAPLQFFVESAGQALRDNADAWQDALKWAQVDDETRFWGHVYWKQGHKEEWLALVRAVMQLQLVKSRPMSPKDWAYFILKDPHYNFSRLRMNRRRFKPPYPSHYPEAVWALMDYLEAYFEPRIDHEGLMAYFELDSIRVEQPTQHEIVAALELWREFGRKSGQSTEVEACLRQLLTE